MNFRDNLHDDLPVFVEPDEFAQIVDVDGVLCQAQLIQHTAEKSQRLTENFDGLHGDFTEIFFMAEPYVKKHGKIPQRGDLVYINKKRYKAERVEDELGMIHLIASAYRQPTPRKGDMRCS